MRRHQEPAVAYDDLAAAAYATSRMPACYAVVKRIMEEIAFSQPDWRPRTMLDFGAGPATAAWAAAEVSICLSCMIRCSHLRLVAPACHMRLNFQKFLSGPANA